MLKSLTLLEERIFLNLRKPKFAKRLTFVYNLGYFYSLKIFGGKDNG